ncbi:MAG: Hsp20/alpha crystallin family protein, partial [Syntrophales bacterium]|nr:Hsp20/alpha crystallin family protein [Syntrophales bacterium]
MASKVKDMVPAGQGSVAPPARREEEVPLFSLQREVNRLFDDFFRGFDLRPLRVAEEGWGGFSPKMDLEETEKEYRITAELPGVEEKDVEVLLTGNSLTL